MDTIIIFAIAILGIVDAELDRRTGRGLIARMQDLIERRKA